MPYTLSQGLFSLFLHQARLKKNGPVLFHSLFYFFFLTMWSASCGFLSVVNRN